MSAVLVAGIGNLFLGDDAFGIEVVRRLRAQPLPPGVDAVDFGIRGIDLVYALLDGYDAAVLVDAVSRGGAPGSLYIIEPEIEAGVPMLAALHELDPGRVLQTVRAMNGRCRRLHLVGCEPESFDDGGGGRIGLSPPVAAAVDPAVEKVRSLIETLIQGRRRDEAPSQAVPVNGGVS